MAMVSLNKEFSNIITLNESFMFAMRQSAELFGMMSHRFQIDDSQRKERIYQKSWIHGPNPDC